MATNQDAGGSNPSTRTVGPGSSLGPPPFRKAKMAKSKVDPDKNWLKEVLERDAEKRKNTPIVSERWWVVDYWPSVRASDEYSDYWTTEKEVFAAGYFYSYDEAEQFLETHTPEAGAQLKVKHQNLRRITEDRWVNW